MFSPAEDQIAHIHGFLKYHGEEDWKNWHPIIASACAKVTNEEYRIKGIEAIRFFNNYFYNGKT